MEVGKKERRILCMIVRVSNPNKNHLREREEKEKSLAIEDFLEQHDSEDTADTPG